MGLYEWIMAVRNYYYVHRNTEPLRDKVIHADLQLQHEIEKRDQVSKEMEELNAEIE